MNELLTNFELDEIIGVLLLGHPLRNELTKRFQTLQSDASLFCVLLKHGEKWRKDHDDVSMREAILFATKKAEMERAG